MLGPLGVAVQQGLSLDVGGSSQAIYATLLVNFSIPSWLYFIWADRAPGGHTLGKRVAGVRTERLGGGRVGRRRALVRTAFKMIPWEVAHAASFLLAPAPGVFTTASWIGLGVAYALTFAYLGLAWRTGGRQSMHDLVAATHVVRAGPRRPASGSAEQHAGEAAQRSLPGTG